MMEANHDDTYNLLYNDHNDVPQVHQTTSPQLDSVQFWTGKAFDLLRRMKETEGSVGGEDSWVRW